VHVLGVWAYLARRSCFNRLFPADPCSSCCLSCLEVTSGLGENGRYVLCNMGATQPIGMYLPPPSRNSTQLCCFDFSLHLVTRHQLCSFSGALFCYGPCNGSSSFPSHFPSHLSHHCLDAWSAGTGYAGSKYK